MAVGHAWWGVCDRGKHALQGDLCGGGHVHGREEGMCMAGGACVAGGQA